MGILRWLVRLISGSPRANVSQARPNAPLAGSSAAAEASQHRPARREFTPRPVDAGHFAPLSGREALREAKGLKNRWGAWFGRRDIVPPISDPRTQLIDRAMVGVGFISGDELAEIHTIGDEMLRRRPDLQGAAALGQQAVSRDQAARDERKRQKKAESAERKRKRAENIARRRATDIVFLGRGVSRSLADRRSHVERLQSHGLVVLSTPADVAQALGISVPRLRWLAFHHPASRSTHYTTFAVPKKSGGERLLAAPKRSIRRSQEWILANILSKVPVHPAAHGFVVGRSTCTNATSHVGKQVLVNTDLEDFFPTITFSRAKGIFHGLGYSPAVATILALLCTESPRRTVECDGKTLHVAVGPRSVPQGACTSPALSNLVARRLDARLEGIARKLGWTYTRYADDASFSASGEAASRIGYLLARIRHISEAEGFRVNERKTRVLRRNTRQSVTGLNVNDGPTIPRPLRRRLRAILHQSQRTGVAGQNRIGHPNFVGWLDGMIAYVSMVQPAQGDQLRARFESVRGQAPEGTQ
jgi:RNA-directed DNA polymerase